ncbi:flavoprotein [Halobacillus litoralis]|uniref:flavoprotein n=1 Tax=Halobacillus litoralis TaxID=45668 RepID=UPI001CD42012|nr:flavoprotein [Halobacillus litoralis]MCA0972460.1 flavoprotein [Halobacillus litoralis]
MSFYTFFETFKERARKHDLGFLKEVIAEEFIAREIRDGEHMDYGREESVEGWRQAFEHFEGQDMNWIYTNHSVTQTKADEWMAVFWVSVVIAGEPLPASNLFFDTFRYEDETWKLVRSYIEAGVKSPVLEKASR